jgi:hypothetical protein
MLQFFKTNAEALGAISAVVTGLAAVAAVIFVPLQLAEADRIQRTQAAREIYREFLNLTAQKPELATADLCALTAPKDRTAYEAYVSYLLFTAEQVLEAEPGWETTMEIWLADHLPMICTFEDGFFVPELDGLVTRLQTGCAEVAPCAGG